MRAATVAKAIAYGTALALWNQLLWTTFAPPAHGVVAGAKLPQAQTDKQPPEVLQSLRSLYLRDAPSSSPPPPQSPLPTQQAPVLQMAPVQAHRALGWNASCSAARAHTDLEGAVVADGYGPRGFSLPPAACCATCAATRGCNIWVSCSDVSKCGQQCWLKWVEDPSAAAVRGSGTGVPWTAGVMAGKDTPGSVVLPSEAALSAVGVVALRTDKGDLR